MICHYRAPDKLHGYRCCHDQVKKPYVTLQDCEACSYRDDTIRGLGDRIERATRKFGVKRCRRCKSWQEWLNGLWPT